MNLLNGELVMTVMLHRSEIDLQLLMLNLSIVLLNSNYIYIYLLSRNLPGTCTVYFFFYFFLQFYMENGQKVIMSNTDLPPQPPNFESSSNLGTKMLPISPGRPGE